ncbi:hypothetical protein [Pseudomonas juntendi]|uniref:hypothetical protein n=2 Tax=Pseudomonas TaxID=286 RepID=UPI001B842403|nr:hypothetical protein [Pseudomonas juntendi]MBR7522688.1 hypothetical protein [Pseudomonas juntendi]
MKLLCFISLCLVVVGCAPVANTNRYGPSEAFVELRPYAANGPFKNFDRPSSLVQAIEEIGGPQKDLETNSDFKKRIEKLGAFSVLSDVKDYQVKFNSETGALTYENRMEDAQSWGFRPNGELLSDLNNFYYSIDLPEDKYHKGDYIGQNSFGAKALIESFESDKIYLVTPAVPKTSPHVVFVSMIADLDISSDEFKSNREKIKLAVSVEPVPNYLYFYKHYISATIRNKKEGEINRYFLSGKLAGVSIVNSETGKVYSKSVRVKFRSY